MEENGGAGGLWSMTPEQRLLALRVLQARVYGARPPDVREGQRRS